MHAEQGGEAQAVETSGHLRRHRVSVFLTAFAVVAFLLGVAKAPEPVVGRRVFGAPTAHVDAQLVSALLEVKDGAWRVREIDTASTFGSTRVALEHRSAGTLLFPLPDAVWPAGGPRLRWSVPQWRIDAEVDIVMRSERPMLAVRNAGAAVGGWRMPAFHSIAPSEAPLILTGFNPLARCRSYAPADGRFLHLGVLTTDPTELQSVDGWRALVEAEMRRLAESVDEGRSSAESCAWWNAKSHEVLTAAALAAVLRVEDAEQDLVRLREDLDRDMTPPSAGRAFHVVATRQAMAAALGVLPETQGRARGSGLPTDILSRFAHPHAAMGWLREVYGADLPASMSDPESGWPTSYRLAPRFIGAPMAPQRPHEIGIAYAGLLLALLGTLSMKGPPHLRRRDVAGIAGLSLYASLGYAIAPHVTMQAVGLVGLGIVVLTLNARGALRVPGGVALALTGGAILLPIASVLAAGPLDAVARVLLFSAIAYLAVAPVFVAEGGSDAPRRTARNRDTLWTSFQLIVVTGAVLALLLAMLDPSSWATRAPRTKWVLLSAGVVLGLAAGVVAYLRDRRVQPAVAVALTLGAASHGTVLVLSAFVTEWTSGAKEVAAIGMIAAAILSLFVVLRFGRAALLARRAAVA